jgi:hypothetical protein
VQEWIREREDKLRLKSELEPEPGIHVEHFCFGKTTHRRIVAESKKCIRRVSVDAIVRETDKERPPRFADVDMTVTFEGVTLPLEDPSLYIDLLGVMPPLEWDGGNPVIPDPVLRHLGAEEEQEKQLRAIRSNVEARLMKVLTSEQKKKFDRMKKASPGTFFMFDKDLGTVQKWLRCVQKGTGEVKEEPKVRDVLGPHALAYRLEKMRPTEKIVVEFTGTRGAHADNIDGVGYSVYADCPVEALSISVTFQDVFPVDPPVAQVFLLRRTITDSHPVHLVGGLECKEGDHVEGNSTTKKVTYSFKNNLLYPRPGYGFVIAWGRLQ